MRDNFYHHTRHCGLYIKKHVVLKYLSLVFCVLSRRILLGLYRCAEEKKVGARELLFGSTVHTNLKSFTSHLTGPSS